MNQKKSFLLIVLMLFLMLLMTIFTACPGGETGLVTTTTTSSTTIPVWTAPTKAEVLAYITGLSDGTIDGVISGQNCFHGNEITSTDKLNGYKTQIEDLHTATGKWVGMIGLDYEYQRVYTSTELSSANKILIDYWKNGGLVTLTLSPQNPWVVDEVDIVANPGNYTGDGSCNDVTHVESLNDLIDPNKAVNKAWIRKLDRIALALKELKDAGVVVLWRPMQEMNGWWFWWGMNSHPDDPSSYGNVFQHMYDYFTITKGLDNLLWVYSPCHSHNEDNNNTTPWGITVDWAYPGDNYVDIVAGTNYDDTLELKSNDYAAYKELGKPLGLAEYSGRDSANDGSLDTRLYASRLKNDYPEVAFWVSWHNFPPEYKLN